MAVTIVSFRWLEILEKEFDKNFVDLDLLIGDLDAEEPDFVHSARQKLAGLSSCFAQLTHKAQTIFQNSAKVEAELIDLRAELVNCKTRQEVLEEESRNLVLQLHSLQLDRLPSNQNPEQYKEKIETALKLSPSKSSYSDEITFRNNSELKKLKNELVQYQNENIVLRNSILALHSEVYGAKLAAKYLDKELAGRIQQLQLLGKEMRTDVRDKLWRQLESEILLHRHKTVIRACRNRTNHDSVDSKIFSDKRFSKYDIFQQKDCLSNLHGRVNRRKSQDIINKTESATNLTRKNTINFNISSNYDNNIQHYHHYHHQSKTNRDNSSNNVNSNKNVIYNNNMNNNKNNNKTYNNNNNNNNINDCDGDGFNENENENKNNKNNATLKISPAAGSNPLNNHTNPTISTGVINNSINNSNSDSNSDSNKSDYFSEKSNPIFENSSKMKKSNVNSYSASSSQNHGKIKIKNVAVNEQKKDEKMDSSNGKKALEETAKSFEITKEKKADDEKGVNESDPIKKNSSSDVEDVLCVVGEKRTVIVKRQTGQGLGISITGGREHGVPILISELEEGGPAYECKNLFVGDAILKVNDISLENTSHFEAVKILTNLETNDVKLVVQFIAVDTDEENSLSEDLYGFRYRFFDTEVMDSSDALGLHPMHSRSAHMPMVAQTPDSNSNDSPTVQHELLQVSNQKLQDWLTVRDESGETNFLPNAETIVETSEKSHQQNLIDIDVEIPKDKNDSDKLKIDLFGFRFQTDIHDVIKEANQDLLNEFVVKDPKPAEAKSQDLIQMETLETKPYFNSKKFEYVDENIFSGLEDHSILDNIMKSFSEDDYSYVENTDKEKTLTSDSGLEVCLSGSDNEAENRNYGDKDYLNNWTGSIPEKIELKTLQHIFDRSFSSNLSSPRGSTSFDDDILSTEHSDEKSNSANDFKNQDKDIKMGQDNSNNVQKCFSKSQRVMDGSKGDYLVNMKNDMLTLKKVKKNPSEVVKRSKCGRKLKDGARKEMKTEKKKNVKDFEPTKTDEVQKKREVNFKITDRFEENLIEYAVKNFDVNQASPNRKPDNFVEVGKKVDYVDHVPDELEETRSLSRRYGLKIPGKGVKEDYNSMVLISDVKSPERCLKVLENHFRHFKPVLESSGKQSEKEAKSRIFRYNRYESFGDPDFGTPV